jgi:hypothetical protein
MAEDRPKTAYEIAMERFRDKDKPEERPLTDAQKAAIGEARQVYQARVAEREILHQAALRRAETPEAVEELAQQYRRDLDRLATDRDRKIAEVKGDKPARDA